MSIKFSETFHANLESISVTVTSDHVASAKYPITVSSMSRSEDFQGSSVIYKDNNYEEVKASVLRVCRRGNPVTMDVSDQEILIPNAKRPTGFITLAELLADVQEHFPEWRSATNLRGTKNSEEPETVQLSESIVVIPQNENGKVDFVPSIKRIVGSELVIMVSPNGTVSAKQVSGGADSQEVKLYEQQDGREAWFQAEMDRKRKTAEDRWNSLTEVERAKLPESEITQLQADMAPKHHLLIIRVPLKTDNVTRHNPFYDQWGHYVGPSGLEWMYESERGQTPFMMSGYGANSSSDVLMKSKDRSSGVDTTAMLALLKRGQDAGASNQRFESGCHRASGDITVEQISVVVSDPQHPELAEKQILELAERELKARYQRTHKTRVGAVILDDEQAALVNARIEWRQKVLAKRHQKEMFGPINDFFKLHTIIEKLSRALQNLDYSNRETVENLRNVLQEALTLPAKALRDSEFFRSLRAGAANAGRTEASTTVRSFLQNTRDNLNNILESDNYERALQTAIEQSYQAQLAKHFPSPEYDFPEDIVLTKQQKEEALQKGLICPITLGFIQKPAVPFPDSKQVFEASALSDAVRANGKCPCTRQVVQLDANKKFYSASDSFMAEWRAFIITHKLKIPGNTDPQLHPQASVRDTQQPSISIAETIERIYNDYVTVTSEARKPSNGI